MPIVNRSLVSVVLAVALTWASLADAHTHGVLQAIEVEPPPTIDGKLAEWKGFIEHLDAKAPSWYMGVSRVEGTTLRESGDAEAWFSACWSDNKLYLSALVLDDSIVKNTQGDVANAVIKADHLDWHLDINHDASYFIESRAPSYQADDFTIRMIPFEKQSGVHGGFFLVDQGGNLLGFKSFQKQTKFASRAVTISGRTGYTVETELDLEKMGFPNLLRVGSMIGLEVTLHDVDFSSGKDRILNWSSTGTRATRDSSSFGDLLLTDRSGSFTVSSSQVSAEDAGYYLNPGPPMLVGFSKILSVDGESPAGHVIWSPKRMTKANNISGLFDPNPFHPLNKPAIRYCQVGYNPDSRKTAFLEMPVGQDPPEEIFTILQEGKTLFRRKWVKWGTLWNRDYYLLNFNGFNGTGRGFILQIGKIKTPPFTIKKGVYEPLAPMALQGFFLAQRCGKGASPYHSACHLDDANPPPPEAEADRQPILQFPPAYGLEEHFDVAGGFHDDGRTGKNMSRFPVALDLMLLTADEFNPKLDADADSVPDLIEWIMEALTWGLKMQDKDGGVFERVVESNGKRYLDTDKWADVTARWVATAALGAHILERRDPQLSSKLESSALRGWAYVSRNQNQPARPCMTGCYPEHPASLFWAAVEMHRLTLEPSYLEAALKRLPQVIEGELEPMSWRGNQTLALLRLYPLLLENQSKARIRRALANHLKTLRQESAKNPFGVRYVANSEEGNSSTLLATAVEIFFLETVFPKLDVLSLIEPYRQWVYGANPSGVCFVVGRGDRSPQFQVNWMNKVLPGSVVPGIVDDGQGFPLYLDFNTFRQANEAALDAAAANLFLSFVKAPYRGVPIMQEEGEADAETLRATEKPLHPSEGAVLDFNTLSVNSFWKNGSGNWTIKNTMASTEEGRVLHCDFKTGEWAMIGISLEGDWTPYQGVNFMIRGSNVRLRVVLDDADGEDWATEFTVPSSLGQVNVKFSDLVKPAWKEKTGNQRRDFDGPKTLKIQILGPEKGWFEIVELNLFK